MDTWILCGYLPSQVYGYRILDILGIRIPDTCIFKYPDFGYVYGYLPPPASHVYIRVRVHIVARRLHNADRYAAVVNVRRCAG